MPQRPTRPKASTSPDKLHSLIEQWTRADVMARLGPLQNDACYAHTTVKKADEIRELVFGTSSLVELAEKFGIRRK